MIVHTFYSMYYCVPIDEKEVKVQQYSKCRTKVSVLNKKGNGAAS